LDEFSFFLLEFRFYFFPDFDRERDDLYDFSDMKERPLPENFLLYERRDG
jgi:hypothetical protein